MTTHSHPRHLALLALAAWALVAPSAGALAALPLPNTTTVSQTGVLTGGGGGVGVREWGRKFGWQAPSDPGQAMVYVGVGNIAAADRLGCGKYDYRGTRRCTTAVLPNGQIALIVDCDALGDGVTRVPAPGLA